MMAPLVNAARLPPNLAVYSGAPEKLHVALLSVVARR